MLYFQIAFSGQLLLIALVIQDISIIHLQNYNSLASRFFLICLFTFQDIQPYSRTGLVSHIQQDRFCVTFQYSLTFSESDLLHDTFHPLRCSFCLAYFHNATVSINWCVKCLTLLKNKTILHIIYIQEMLATHKQKIL